MSSKMTRVYPNTANDMQSIIRDLKFQVEALEKAFQKGKTIIDEMLIEAESLPKNNERRADLMKRAQRALDYNETVKKSLKKITKKLHDHQDSLANASKLYTAKSVPKGSPTKSKRGGSNHYKKNKKNKKTKKYKKSKTRKAKKC